ncbi:MAG: site-2 protease family protein [Vicinamibacterales bacterium]
MRALDQIPTPPWPGDDGTYYAPPIPPRSRERRWLHVLLLALTVVTTTLVGGLHYASFEANFTSQVTLDFSSWSFYAHGLWYSLTVLAILGCHEMGHYVACLHYRVDATPPFFLPAPLPLTGTLGAFIRIRSRIPSKVALFDIGLAGPIAGFVVAVPALFVGLWLSRVIALPTGFEGYELGEPLLFRFASWVVFGSVPDGYSVNMHPMAFAAWFGLLATALNLFPIGQLDGGHVTYAVLGRRSTVVTVVMILVAVGLTVFVSSSWLVWTLLLVAMLFVMGPQHPPTLDEHEPLDASRRWLAVFGLVMLILCFTPAPIEPFVTGGL